MEPFVYEALPVRVIFGSGTVAQLKAEAERLGVRRVLVLSTPGRGEVKANEIAALLGERSAGVHAGAVMHTPVAVTERAVRIVRERAADAVVAFGGGSTTGLGKAIALRTDLPQIVLPTTYAGSEMTPILGETKDGQDDAAEPESSPGGRDLRRRSHAGTAGRDLGHLWHERDRPCGRGALRDDRNPVISLMAEDGIAALARALPRISEDSQDRAARSDALYGAWLCGTCLGAVSMALHHKLCHVLGGTFDLPHAETHTVILPHATACNAGAAPEAMARVARALDSPDPPQALYELAGRLGAKPSLRELGMPQDGIERVVEQTMAAPYPNPRPLDVSAIRELVIRAWNGEPPHSG